MKKDKLKQIFAWKGLRSFEFRVLSWAWRAAVILGFVSYLAGSAQGAWAWAQLKWVRAQDISRLDVLLKDAAARGDFKSAEAWMQCRPLAESKAVMDRAEPYVAHLSPFVFFNFSDRAARLGDSRGADLWNMIAHFRLRFDLLRCGLPDGVNQGRRLIDFLSKLRENYYRSIPEEERRRLARKVLEFDDRHPADDNPERLCRMLATVAREDYKLLPREEWDSFRKGMHETAEMTLKGPLMLSPMSAKKAVKTPAPKKAAKKNRP